MGRAGVRVIAFVAVGLCALASGAGTAAARARWSPPAHLTWYWQLQGRVRVAHVAASDIDAFDNGAAEGGPAPRSGMAVCEKNDPEQAAKLEPSFDGVLDEQCNQYHECDAFRPYLRRASPCSTRSTSGLRLAM
ncbi:MAG TPA: endo alpha-1,4 polygalactosaminidase [Solirubrobacteraceae bacterium]|jgi:hypothetical protein|nr:endo alpha-1,4 polygalactosaminidase [Solirubrobacteraceae bacterium]